MRNRPAVIAATPPGPDWRNADAQGAVIANLKADAFDTSDPFHTEIGELNKLNAAGTVQAQQGQDHNLILASIAEQGLVGAKRLRDAEARAIEQDIAFRQAAAVALTQHDGMADAMATFKLR
ncbi:MAG: hypothetical protein M3Z23_16515 [Acidobacteriota bacterium]|nr:hypothetical protein [Acidobacteriota bacterium]